MTLSSEYIGLDFETYSPIDITQHGLARYVDTKYFQPLLAGLTWRQGTVLASKMISFVNNPFAVDTLNSLIKDRIIIAHNAGFEQTVLRTMGLDYPSEKFIDSAVLARAAGAAGKLEVAAPQLLGVDKMASGLDLIKLFSIPGKYQEETLDFTFDPRIIRDHPDQWMEFSDYCLLDSELSFKLAEEILPGFSPTELQYAAITLDMNNTGWRVDLDIAEIMQARYEANLHDALEEFCNLTGAHDLNLSSPLQIQEWCRRRGVNSSSFDEKHIEKLIKQLNRKLGMGGLSPARVADYEEVLLLLKTKQILGGSSLKKLTTILDTTTDAGRLHDQYLHIGADATFRTTGRGVQMQNLKRLHGSGDNMNELFDPDVHWDNEKLASNLRQVFTATDPLGQLIVGDFASVESRALAWQAGENWKIEAYSNGEDLYKVQASHIFYKKVEDITKDERQIGKVGELACGYGAGGQAVKDFAEKMGVVMSEIEAAKLVTNWRQANPATTAYWTALNGMLFQCLTQRKNHYIKIPHGRVYMLPVDAPKSLQQQVNNTTLPSIHIEMTLDDGLVVMNRVIHGVHMRDGEVRYWKPSELKSGDLWKDTFMHPVLKQPQPYRLYGGKLAGLMTQSLCREVFFHSLQQIHEWTLTHTNVKVVGQFHDEIVLDWAPAEKSGDALLGPTKAALKKAMTSTFLPAFPLGAEIKNDYRYTK